MSTAIKTCFQCGFEGFVYARKVHCPSCKTKNALINNHDALEKTKERDCECGCGSTVIAPMRFVSGHNGRRKGLQGIIRKDGRAYIYINCMECGKRVLRREDSAKRRNGNNYCGKECASVANGRNMVGKVIEKLRKGKTLECKYCKTEFYASPTRIKQRAKFCSRNCFTEWEKASDVSVRKGFIGSADNRGEKNGRYKHGKRIGTNTNKPKVRRAVIKRDGNYCLMCGKPGPGLHLHRIIYGSQGGKYEDNNCVLLCGEHHALVHTSKRKWMPILQEHIAKKYREINLLHSLEESI